MKVKQIRFTPTGEYRRPCAGEWYRTEIGPSGFLQAQRAPDDERGIYTRSEVEVEIPDPVPGWISKAVAHWVIDGETAGPMEGHFARHYHAAKERGEA